MFLFVFLTFKETSPKLVPYGEFLFADWYSCNCVQSKKGYCCGRTLCFI